MQIKNLLPLAMGAAVSAQSLTEALAANNASLSALTSLLTANPALVETLSGLSDITILAPSNQALAAFTNSSAAAAAADPAIISAILTYHVLNGTIPSSALTNMTQFVPTLLTNETYANITGGQVVGARLNGTTANIYSGLLQESTVTTVDLNFTGGVIHIIDEVLTIPLAPSDTALAAGLSALYGALNATSLVDTVDGLRDVTIFAPSNAAFSSIGSIASNISTEMAASILTYHVVAGQVIYSSDITENTTLTTVNGEDIAISVIEGKVYVNSALVITPDVLVSNGVVHVIDGVLNPMNATAAPNPSTTVPAFPGASTATDGSTPFTSGVSASTTITNAPTQSGAPGAGAGTGTSSSVAGAARALQTGGVGLGALFGGALVLAL